MGICTGAGHSDLAPWHAQASVEPKRGKRCRCTWSLYLVVVLGRCTWSLYLVVVLGRCTWSWYLVVVLGRGTWSLYLVVLKPFHSRCGRFFLYYFLIFFS